MRCIAFYLLRLVPLLTFLLAGNAKADDALNHWFYRDTNQVNRVRFVNGQFIALGNNGLLLTSPDGSNWTKRVTGTTANLTGAAYGGIFPWPNEYVVVGAGTLLISGDTINWTNLGNYGYLNDIAHGFVEFVAAGSRQTTNQPNIFSAQNPTNWMGETFTGGGSPEDGSPYVCSAVGYDPVDAVFVTAGGAEFADDVWTRYDGSTSFKTGFSDQQVTGIAYGNGTFIMVGWEGWPYESTNSGSSWFFVAGGGIDPYYTNPQTGFPMVGNDIVFGNGMFVVAEANYHPETLLVTTNGQTWAHRSPSVSTPGNSYFNITSVAYGNGTFVGVSYPFNTGVVTLPGGIYQSMPVNIPFITLKTNTTAMDLVISGMVGQKYRLQISPDLSSWSDLWVYTNTAPTMEYVDPINLKPPQRFYRVVSP